MTFRPNHAAKRAIALARADGGSVKGAASVWDKLAQTWPARMAKDAYAAVTLPGDVYQGNISMWGSDGHTNPEVIHRAADLAGVMAGGSIPAIERSAVGSAGGRAGHSALPMDLESRMRRAEGMGFFTDMPLYHGTGKTFDRFKSVPTDAEGMTAPGVSAARDPEIANYFAGMSQARGRGHRPQVHQLLHRAENPATLHLRGDETHGQVSATLRDAFDAGYDAVKLKNYSGIPGKKGEIIIVRNGNQLRSPYAAFDPAKRDSSFLLASGGPDGRLSVLQSATAQDGKNSHRGNGSGMNGGGAVRRAVSLARHYANGGTVFDGYLEGDTGGRTDNREIDVGAGAYVIPADVLSGLGEGNSRAGADALERLFKMGAYAEDGEEPAFANGGIVTKPVPIVAASGELVVPPNKVAEIGGGDMERGHSILDAMVSHVRKKTIKTLRKLPKPKKS